LESEGVRAAYRTYLQAPEGVEMSITIACMEIVDYNGKHVRHLTAAETKVLWREKPVDSELIKIVPDYDMTSTIKVYHQTFGDNFAVVEE
jgi:hypothetical protein